MGELEKYGLLSVGSILVLFLILTFSGPEVPGAEYRDASPPAESPQQASRNVGLRSAELRKDLPRAEVPERDTSPVRTDDDLPRDPQGRQSDTSPVPVAFHTVAKGETLSRIAKRYLGDTKRWPELVAVNGGLDPARLRVGQRIAIPTESSRQALAEQVGRAKHEVVTRRDDESHTASAANRPSASQHQVSSGDTLGSIAAKYYGDHMRWRAIYEANKGRIPKPDQLQVGTMLDLP